MTGESGTATTPAAPVIRAGDAPKTLMMSPNTTDDQIPINGETPAICAKAIEVGTLASATTTPLSASLTTPPCPPSLVDKPELRRGALWSRGRASSGSALGARARGWSTVPPP